MTERQRLPLRAKVAAIVTLGGAAVLAACGGKAENPNPPAETPTIGPSPTRTVENPTQTVIPTVVPTIEPTAEPTPQPPTFEELEAAVNSAYAVVGLYTPDEIARQLKFCNEQDIPEDAVYTAFVVNGCGIVGEAMLSQFQETQNEVFIDIVSDLELFTFGKIDKFVTEGRLTQSQGNDLKILADNLYFTP